MQTSEKLDKIYHAIKGQLEENVTYVRTESNYHRGSFHKISDGKNVDAVPAAIHWKNRQDNIENLGFRLDDAIRELKKTLSNRGLLVLSLSRENGFSYEFATAETIVQTLILELKQEYSSGFSEEIVVTIAPDQTQDEPEIEVFSKFTRADASSGESDVMSGEHLVKCLYDVLDRKLTKIWISGADAKVEILTIPAIPGVTGLFEPQEDLTLDASDLNGIYAFLESFSEAKIQKGIDILLKNPDFTKKAEKRYLQLIKNRLGDQATLSDFPKAALTRTQVNLLDGEHVGKNFLSLSYFDEHECELFVDFVGALVMNHLDLGAYRQKAEACENDSQLLELYSTYCHGVRIGIKAEAEAFPGGWFGKLSLKLHDHKIQKVLFEKTHFTMTDSDKLKAFLFYLTLNFSGELYLDVFQSYLPELTSFFWFAPIVPRSSWGDTDIAIPKSTLRFTRKVFYRDGDDGHWKQTDSSALPLQSN
ncbi:hypothetical protein [Flavobacterium sp.]|uniref:hypothetical protein n=1 Tax=Flavobacterium sp. TaxID=239 RepID=UPI0012234875|nr:hypothetical protein [Flavobacterium sp.]RZJ70378.1 MAG: hypothetical protein EOO49_13935 [Flavobacterium sp.]